MISKATIKYIHSLQQKKYRGADAVFVAEGTVVLYEMIAEGLFDLVSLYATDKWINEMPDEVHAAITDKVEKAELFELEKMSSRPSPVGALAVFRQRSSSETFEVKGKINLVLDGLQDPGNLGTIIRTADWFGVQHIFCSHNTADMYNPKVVQSTMASLGRVQVHYLDLEELLTHIDIPVVAATLGGKPLDEMPVLSETVLVIGNEAKGISGPIMTLAKHKVTITKKGKAESLNAAVAAGILMHYFCK